ncbi:hypothetical protein OsI_21524 [Oryza sativa Indica Group]|jgi:ribosomal protein L22|uniref:Uncharacterized protein n=2 Tax=Oryza sativa TaxID=4530 RepID=A3B852_ORYSJ|nr:hypothetical protein OsI_21524 [Oryza sativa Indica Group]EAZ35741.1 hypothetical protein OsJ_20032 [Oryza sativa Japonica Group]
MADNRDGLKYVYCKECGIDDWVPSVQEKAHAKQHRKQNLERMNLLRLRAQQLQAKKAMEASKAAKKANSEAKKAKPQAKKYPNKHSSPVKKTLEETVANLLAPIGTPDS